MKIINLKKTKPKKAIQETVRVLKDGGLVVYPTETCYGLGVNATSPKAVEKLLAYKGKRAGKAVSIAVVDQKMAGKYVEINQTAKNLYQNFLPGPLTIVSKSKGKVIPQLEENNKTLGIRIPDYSLILQLIKVFSKPITSTSANTSGKKPPYSLRDLIKYTSKKKREMIDLFLDAGKLPYHPPSSVVDTTLNELKLLRQGEITIPYIKGQSFVSPSEEKTKKIARQILKKYQHLLKTRPLIFALQGELGTGKTQFVKGLAQGLKIKNNVPSPTYILMREYFYQLKDIKGVLYHIDTWRMESKEELLGLGLNKMLKPKNIIAIEWLQKVKPVLENLEKKEKVKVVWITIDYLGENKRRIKYR